MNKTRNGGAKEYSTLFVFKMAWLKLPLCKDKPTHRIINQNRLFMFKRDHLYIKISKPGITKIQFIALTIATMLNKHVPNNITFYWVPKKYKLA